jgi:hypothetical protein
MAIKIKIDAEHLEKLAYIGEYTHCDPNTVLAQEIDRRYRQLQSESIAGGVENLFWSRSACDYITKQSVLFDTMLPALIEQYAGMYIIFEDGKVIDADIDEDVLLDRVWETDIIQAMISKHQGIFCHLVPIEIDADA